MTTTHNAASRIVQHASALAILLAHRHARSTRSATVHCIRMHCSAIRVLRAAA